MNTLKHDVICGNCREVLSGLDDESMDALVTDPPAGIGFMSKSWDSDKGGREIWITWLETVMRETLRVLKPGAYGLVWALPRTSHWTGMALELAGFEMRDVITHLFGTGWPKSHNHLKPGHEMWFLVRKPLKGSVAVNVLEHGTGALNIDGCRIKTNKPRATVYSGMKGAAQGENAIFGSSGKYLSVPHPAGRWPANVVLDEEAACMLDAQSGVLQSGGGVKNSAVNHGIYNTRAAGDIPRFYGANKGGASRFFYVAKASPIEREAGLKAIKAVPVRRMQGEQGQGSTPKQTPRKPSMRANTHPTVKSIELMRWLVRLITPAKGRVLDPFAGSGSTGVACVMERVSFLGIELDEFYASIAQQRIAHQKTIPMQALLF